MGISVGRGDESEEDGEATDTEEWEPEDPKFGYGPDRHADSWEVYSYLKDQEVLEY